MHSEESRTVQKLYSLWYTDLQARRRFQVWTILIAFSYGVFNALALGRPEKQVTWEALGVVCLLTVGFSLFYCLRTKASKVGAASYARLRDVFRKDWFLEVGLASTVILVGASLVRYIPHGPVQAAALDVRLRRALSSPYPFDSDTIDEVTSAVHTATADRLSIDPQLVNAEGKRFVDASRQNPKAWPVALAFVQYRSALNGLTPPVNLRDAKPISENVVVTQYYGETNTGLQLPRLSFVGIAPKNQAAKLNLIGRDLNANLDIGNALLVLTGGSMRLDNMQLKNVVVQNTDVIYEGGPIILENVHFLNCNFEIKRDPNSEELTAYLLEPGPITFSR